MRELGTDAVAATVFKHTLRVRYSECDPQGVVFNANYVAYFDVIITELWREALGRYQDMVEAGADMVVAEVNVRFLGPAGFDDELDFEARLTRLGETAISTRIDSSTGGNPVVEGHMRHVFIDPATKQKRPIPTEVRDALAPYLADDA
jgi:acyl-CoA thioester hydrolase